MRHRHSSVIWPDCTDGAEGKFSTNIAGVTNAQSITLARLRDARYARLPCELCAGVGVRSLAAPRDGAAQRYLLRMSHANCVNICHVCASAFVLVSCPYSLE